MSWSPGLRPPPSRAGKPTEGAVEAAKPAQFCNFVVLFNYGNMGFVPGNRWRLVQVFLLTFASEIAHGFVYNTSAETCGISAIPPSPTLPSCGANATATLDEAIARAHLYAPVVHFHSLEQYHLQASWIILIWY